MRSSEYRAWMEHAFIHTQGWFAQTYARPRRDLFREEHLRSAFVQGLLLARPEAVDRVRTEYSTAWSSTNCVHCASNIGQRRPLQHDIAILPAGGDNGALMEVKWVTADASASLAADLWRLSLSRSTTPERTATRVYLLVGGAGASYSASITALRKRRLALRWSAAGRPRLAALTGLTTHLHLASSLHYPLSVTALREVMSWGHGSHGQPHVRSGTEVFAELRAYLVASWYSSQLDASWKLALWELKKNPGATEVLPVAVYLRANTPQC